MGRMAVRGAVAAALVAGLLVVGPVAPALGAGIVVTTYVDGMINDGACNLREAIVAANTNVATGGCAAGSSTGTDTITFNVGEVVLSPLTSDLPSITAPVLIDGTIPGTTPALTLFDADGFKAFYVSATTATIRMLQLLDPAGDGGGVYNASGTVTLDRVAIQGGSGGSGGAVYNSGTMAVTDSLFLQNEANDGGAIYNAGGATLTITRTAFQENESFYGGAIFNNGTATISRSVFDTNNGLADGGAIQGQGTLSVTTSTFRFNGTEGAGGAIAANQPTTITRSTFVGNGAVVGGGVSIRATATIANSTFYANSALLGGGAIHVGSSGATASVLNSTVVGNSATTDGAGISRELGTLTVRNSVVAGNTGASEIGGTATVTSSLVGVDPNTIYQVALADNGGPTPTLRLLPTAFAAIGDGDDGACAASPVSGVDQRGVVRPATGCDIGAIERETTDPTTTAPKTSLRAGVTLSDGKPRARVTWTGKDTGGSGVDTYRLDRSVNGGSWSTVAGALESPSRSVVLTPGKTYRYRVRARDFDGNISSFVYGPTLLARLVQQGGSAFSYRGTWSGSTSSVYSGGSARYSRTGGASVSFTATGRSFALVSTTGPKRGKAKIYVNGTYLETIDLYAATTTYRVQAWAKTYSTSKTRTIKVVVSGTAGRERVDIDGFAVLR